MKTLMVNGPLKGQWLDTAGLETFRYPRVASVDWLIDAMSAETEYDEYRIIEQESVFFGYRVKIKLGFTGNPSMAGKDIAAALYQRDVLEHGGARW